MDDIKQCLNIQLQRAISTHDGLPNKSDKSYSHKSKYMCIKTVLRASMAFLPLSDTVVIDAMFMVHIKPTDNFNSFFFFFFFELMLNVPVNSHGHVGTLPPK